MEEKKARIAELEASLKDSGRVMYMEDDEVKEMKQDYEERMKALDEALKMNGSKQLMQKRMQAEMRKSKKTEEVLKEMRVKSKENTFALNKKDKELKELKDKLDSMDREHQHTINELKLKHNAEVDELQRKITELQSTITSLKESAL